MITCFRCPSTATHFPRVILSRVVKTNDGPEVNNMTALVNRPVCSEHRSPLVEATIPASTMGEFRTCYVSRYLYECDPSCTQIEWLSVENEAVKNYLSWREGIVPSPIAPEAAPDIPVDTTMTDSQIAEMIRDIADDAGEKT